MIIDRHIDGLVIHADEPVSAALRRIDANRNRLVFVVDGNRRLEGILTDGDFRRWLLAQAQPDLQRPVREAMRPDCRRARLNDPPARITALFSEQVSFLPLLDAQDHLVAVARPRRRHDAFTIGPFTLDAQSPVFVIAEVGINHNGDPALARRLVDAAADAGADCVKFQMRNLADLYRNAGDATDAREDLGTQYTLDLLSRFELDPDEMLRLFTYCHEREIFPFVTPWDLATLQYLEQHGLQAYKVASADLTNHDLLTALARTGKPLICSTGMASEAEIIESVNLLRREGAQYALLHCNSTYPAPFKDLNLRYLTRLREIGECPVGYSGHERGWHIAVAAVARGAKIIEKHITVDRTLEGNDHQVSLLPDEFAEMVRRIRETEQALGSGEARALTQGEMMNRTTLAKSVVVTRAVRAGEVITADLLGVKSPGRGLQPNRKADLVGRPARRDMQAGDFFFPSDLDDQAVQARPYRFRRPWGVAVRYHDYRAILAKSNPDFIEFHLSYKDMELDHTQFFDRPYPALGFTVHSPDLFPGDHLLNLADADDAHRARSVAELQRVVDLTRDLKRWFPSVERPLIIASLGGYTRDRILDGPERMAAYARLEASLRQIDATGVEIIAQTLPPFPWYFGGQLYLSLFMQAEDTRDFCRRTGLRLCFDISHSKLACTHFKWSFKEFTDIVAPYTAHLHIADARGVDGEGLQVGEGDLDFVLLAEQLERHCPRASFIPEIWQGHKNDGEGFWQALERLEAWF